KTNIIQFHLGNTNQFNIQGLIKLGSEEAKQEISVKFLGLYIDNRLTWGGHVEHVCKRLRTMGFALSRLAKKWCLRIISGRRRFETCKPLFGELKILTLAGLVGYELCSFVKGNPKLFVSNGHYHQYPTRSRGLISVAAHSEVRAKKPYLTLNLRTNGLKVTSEPPQRPGRRAACKDRIVQRSPIQAAAMLDVA
ncbi:hypothetical protein J6590_102710, partial [Homalodisca vitripennis]